MIRSPMTACTERRLETSAVVVTMVLALFVPSFLGLVALLAHDAGAAWLEAYRPVVYLEPDADPQSVDRLVTEIEGWPGVSTVDVRQPEDAYALLDERLGRDDLDALGVSASMFPVSLEVVPRYPVAGHVDLVAEVAALEARMEVDAVDVPSSIPLKLVSAASLIAMVAMLLGLLALLAAGVALSAYLRRLRELETDLEAVLGIFGAYPSDIRRPTLVRGTVLGLWSGIGVTVLLGSALAVWQAQAPGALGLEAFISPWTWPLAAIPVLAGPALGAVVGWMSASRGVQRTRSERAAIFA